MESENQINRYIVFSCITQISDPPPPSTPQFGQLDPFISARHNNILLVWYWYDMIRYDNDDNNDDCNDSYDDVDDNFGI